MKNSVDMKGFAIRLTEFSKRKGLNLSELSRQSGVPKATLHNWTCGKVPRLTHLRIIANILEVPLYELCFGCTDPFISAVHSDDDSELIAGEYLVKITKTKVYDRPNAGPTKHNFSKTTKEGE